MEDLKRLIFPAIAAVILHGLLLSFQFQKQQKVKPVIKGIPIKLEINSVYPKTVVSSIVEEKKEENIPRHAPPPILSEQIIESAAFASQQQEKRIIKPKLTKKVVPVKERKKAFDIQERQLEKQLKVPKKVPTEEIIDESAVKQALIPVTVEAAESGNGPEKSLPKKETSIIPIPRKATPYYRQNKRPPYPVMAKRRGYEGEVLLHVLVDMKGSVSELKIKQSSGHSSLDRAALKAVKSWLFSPAKEGGKAVPMWVVVPIEFQLK